MLVHEHALKELRRRMGSDADMLVNAAGRGSSVAVGLIEKRSGAEAFTQAFEGAPVAAFEMDIRGYKWEGASISVDGHLPETIRQAAIGQPLGRVVGGTGFDDLTIRSVSASKTDPNKQWINVVPRRIETSSLAAPDVIERTSLFCRGVVSYVCGGAYEGMGGGMTELLVTMMGLITLMGGTVLACALLPNYAIWIAGAVALGCAALFLRPKEDWQLWMRQHVRGRPYDPHPDV